MHQLSPLYDLSKLTPPNNKKKKEGEREIEKG